MNKILFIYTKRSSFSAEYIRVKYFIESFEENGYKVVKYEVAPDPFHKYIYYLSNTFSLPFQRIRIENEVDLVVATTPPILNALIGYKYALKQNKPLVIDIRDIWEEYARTTRRIEYTIKLLNKIIEKYYSALKYASLITVTTDKMLQYYENIIGNKEIHVIPNGVDPIEIKCSGFEEKEYDFVYLANFDNPYHAVEVLIDSIKNTQYSLLIIGSGKYLSKVKKYVVEKAPGLRIKYAGSIPHNELPKYLCRSKVGVSGRPFINNPEYLYTIPVKIYEYLGAGIPVLAYGPPNSAVEEFIAKYNIGYYVEKNDKEYMLEKINDLVSKHREYYVKCISTANIYNRRVIAKNFVKLINRVLEKSA